MTNKLIGGLAVIGGIALIGVGVVIIRNAIKKNNENKFLFAKLNETLKVDEPIKIKNECKESHKCNDLHECKSCGGGKNMCNQCVVPLKINENTSSPAPSVENNPLLGEENTSHAPLGATQNIINTVFNDNNVSTTTVCDDKRNHDIKRLRQLASGDLLNDGIYKIKKYFESENDNQSAIQINIVNGKEICGLNKESNDDFINLEIEDSSFNFETQSPSNDAVIIDVF